MIQATENKVAILTRDIDPDLRNRFKAQCARQGVTMRDAIVSLIELALTYNIPFDDVGDLKITTWKD